MTSPRAGANAFPLAAARRVFARHQPRQGAGAGCCAFCGGSWLTKGKGHRVEGCAARQLAARALAETGTAFIATPRTAGGER